VSDDVKIDKLIDELDGADDRIKLGERAYQRGFDHGRRRAAEDVAKLIDAFDGNTRDILLKAARVALNGPEAALSAPSEPVPDGPRVWAMPTIPADVGRLTDADGETWYRCGPRHWQPARTHRDYGETELIARRGPLTEVVEEATP